MESSIALSYTIMHRGFVIQSNFSIRKRTVMYDNLGKVLNAEIVIVDNKRFAR